MPAKTKDSPIILTGRLLWEKERRGSVNRSYGGGNAMIPAAAAWTKDRAQVPFLDNDHHKNISTQGRRMMLSLGLHLYCAFDIVRGTTEEVAELASHNYVPEYRGTNAEFKTRLESLLYIHDMVCDVAGGPWNMRQYRKMLVRASYIYGDVGTVYVKDELGQPKLQIIPSHRIDSCGHSVVEGGPFDGAQIIDGVIVGDYCNPLAYRVMIGDPKNTKEFQDIPADRMKLHYVPLFPGQLRGLSLIGFSAWNWQDLQESKRFELLAQKAGAGRVFQEWNENGEPPVGSDAIIAPTSGVDASGTPSGLWFETIDGGINTYFKSSDRDSRLEAVKFDRPSANQQAFSEQTIREALYACGWSIDFSLLPTKVSGASLRVLIEKINRMKSALGCDLIEPALRRFDGFRIPVFMEETKELPYASDWHNIEYVGPPELTSDKKYDSQVAIEEVRAGFSSTANECRKRGESEEDVEAQNAKSVERLYDTATRLAKKFGRPVSEVINLLRPPTPNGIQEQPQAESTDEEPETATA